MAGSQEVLDEEDYNLKVDLAQSLRNGLIELFTDNHQDDFEGMLEYNQWSIKTVRYHIENDPAYDNYIAFHVVADSSPKYDQEAKFDFSKKSIVRRMIGKYKKLLDK